MGDNWGQLGTNGSCHRGGWLIQASTLVNGTNAKDPHVEFQRSFHGRRIALTAIAVGCPRRMIGSKIMMMQIDVIKFVGLDEFLVPANASFVASLTNDCDIKQFHL